MAAGDWLSNTGCGWLLVWPAGDAAALDAAALLPVTSSSNRWSLGRRWIASPAAMETASSRFRVVTTPPLLTHVSAPRHLSEKESSPSSLVTEISACSRLTRGSITPPRPRPTTFAPMERAIKGKGGAGRRKPTAGRSEDIAKRARETCKVEARGNNNRLRRSRSYNPLVEAAFEAPRHASGCGETLSAFGFPEFTSSILIPCLSPVVLSPWLCKRGAAQVHSVGHRRSTPTSHRS